MQPAWANTDCNGHDGRFDLNQNGALYYRFQNGALYYRLPYELLTCLFAYLLQANSVGGHPKVEQLEGQMFLITCFYNRASPVSANYPRTAQSKRAVGCRSPLRDPSWDGQKRQVAKRRFCSSDMKCSAMDAAGCERC